MNASLLASPFAGGPAHTMALISYSDTVQEAHHAKEEMVSFFLAPGSSSAGRLVPGQRPLRNLTDTCPGGVGTTPSARSGPVSERWNAARRDPGRATL